MQKRWVVIRFSVCQICQDSRFVFLKTVGHLLSKTDCGWMSELLKCDICKYCTICGWMKSFWHCLYIFIICVPEECCKATFQMLRTKIVEILPGCSLCLYLFWTCLCGYLYPFLCVRNTEAFHCFLTLSRQNGLNETDKYGPSVNVLLITLSRWGLQW